MDELINILEMHNKIYSVTPYSYKDIIKKIDEKKPIFNDKERSRINITD